MSRKTANASERSTYKAAVLDLQTVLLGLRDTTDNGLAFWRDELTAITARHLVKLGAVEAAKLHYKPETTDRATAAQHAATVAAAAARKALRGAKREDREDAKEAWGRLEDAERTIETLRAELADTVRSREYWEERCIAAEAWIHNPSTEAAEAVAVAVAEYVDVPF